MMARVLDRISGFTLIVVGAIVSSACSSTSTCSRDADLVIIPADKADIIGNTYQSAPFGGPYAYFPPARTISFEHNFGVVPVAPQFWVTFSPNGTLAPAAGNMAELRGIDDDPEPALDETRIAVHNDTCSDFYLWVVLQKPTP